MTPAMAILLTFGIGFVAGLRTMTAPAAVAWAVHLGWINLHGSHLNFMGSMWTVTIFTLAALGEYVVDTLPGTPARTSAPALTARICTGMLSGACVGFENGSVWWVGAAVGVLGALAGAFGGYETRKRLVRALNVRDLMVAIPEDLVAIGLAIVCCLECLRLRAALASLAVHIHSRIS